MSTLTEATIRRVIYPLWAARDHPGLSSFLREFEKTQFWPAARIQELQWQRLRKMLRFAYERSPYYQERFKQAGIHPQDIRTPESFLHVPILTKDDIRQNQVRLLARGIPVESYVDNFTGGSTGSPICFKVSKKRWASRKAITHRHDFWTGWKIGEKRGELWGHPEQRPFNTTWGRLRNALLYRSVILNTFDVDQLNFSRFVDELRRQKVRHLIAYSRSLLMFANYIAKLRIELPLLESAITTAECISPDERAFIEQTLQCRTFDRYGCREFSVIASECEAHAGLHLAAETLLVEFVVRGRWAQPGEVGEIFVTDLLNEAMPFIRYKVGDMGAPIEGQCSCGRGLPRMQMVAGRVTDFIHTPDDRWLSGVAINTYLISQMPGVRQAQLIQQECDHLHFRLVESQGRSSIVDDFLRHQVPQMFGPRMKYTVEWVTKIHPEPSGKVRVTVSSCAARHGIANVLSGPLEVERSCDPVREEDR